MQKLSSPEVLGIAIAAIIITVIVAIASWAVTVRNDWDQHCRNLGGQVVSTQPHRGSLCITDDGRILDRR